MVPLWEQTRLTLSRLELMEPTHAHAFRSVIRMLNLCLDSAKWETPGVRNGLYLLEVESSQKALRFSGQELLHGR